MAIFSFSSLITILVGVYGILTSFIVVPKWVSIFSSAVLLLLGLVPFSVSAQRYYATKSSRTIKLKIDLFRYFLGDYFDEMSSLWAIEDRLFCCNNRSVEIVTEDNDRYISFSRSNDPPGFLRNEDLPYPALGAQAYVCENPVGETNIMSDFSISPAPNSMLTESDLRSKFNTHSFCFSFPTGPQGKNYFFYKVAYSRGEVSLSNWSTSGSFFIGRKMISEDNLVDLVSSLFLTVSRPIKPCVFSRERRGCLIMHCHRDKEFLRVLGTDKLVFKVMRRSKLMSFEDDLKAGETLGERKEIDEVYYSMFLYKKMCQKYGVMLAEFLMNYTTSFFGFDNIKAIEHILKRGNSSCYRNISTNWKSKRYLTDVSYILECAGGHSISGLDKKVRPTQNILLLRDKIPKLPFELSRSVINVNKKVRSEDIAFLLDDGRLKENKVSKEKVTKASKLDKDETKGDLILTCFGKSGLVAPERVREYNKAPKETMKGRKYSEKNLKILEKKVKSINDLVEKGHKSGKGKEMAAEIIKGDSRLNCLYKEKLISTNFYSHLRPGVSKSWNPIKLRPGQKPYLDHLKDQRIKMEEEKKKGPSVLDLVKIESNREIKKIAEHVKKGLSEISNAAKSSNSDFLEYKNVKFRKVEGFDVKLDNFYKILGEIEEEASNVICSKKGNSDFKNTIIAAETVSREVGFGVSKKHWIRDVKELSTGDPKNKWKRRQVNLSSMKIVLTVPSADETLKMVSSKLLIEQKAVLRRVLVKSDIIRREIIRKKEEVIQPNIPEFQMKTPKMTKAERKENNKILKAEKKKDIQRRTMPDGSMIPSYMGFRDEGDEIIRKLKGKVEFIPPVKTRKRKGDGEAESFRNFKRHKAVVYKRRIFRRHF